MNLEMEMTCGACPVQIEGMIEGMLLYFRARGSHWQFAIHETDPVGVLCGHVEGWTVRGDWNQDDYLAGYMDPKVAKAIVIDCCRLWTIAQQDYRNYLKRVRSES